MFGLLLGFVFCQSATNALADALVVKRHQSRGDQISEFISDNDRMEIFTRFHAGMRTSYVRLKGRVYSETGVFTVGIGAFTFLSPAVPGREFREFDFEIPIELDLPAHTLMVTLTEPNKPRRTEAIFFVKEDVETARFDVWLRKLRVGTGLSGFTALSPNAQWGPDLWVVLDQYLAPGLEFQAHGRGWLTFQGSSAVLAAFGGVELGPRLALPWRWELGANIGAHFLWFDSSFLFSWLADAQVRHRFRSDRMLELRVGVQKSGDSIAGSFSSAIGLRTQVRAMLWPMLYPFWITTNLEQWNVFSGASALQFRLGLEFSY